MVLAHELGHWRRRHVHRLLALTAAAMLPGFFVLHLLLGSGRVQALAGIGGAGAPAAEPPALLAVVAMQALWLPVTLRLSRGWERQTDLDAVTLSGDPERSGRWGTTWR